jgi:hypothetical protein
MKKGGLRGECGAAHAGPLCRDAVRRRGPAARPAPRAAGVRGAHRVGGAAGRGLESVLLIIRESDHLYKL